MAHLTPIGAAVRGAVAGVVGIAAMDAFLYARYRSGGGAQEPIGWEFGGPSDWESVSAPAQVGRRLYEGFRQRPLEARHARLTNNVMHWGYGIAWGGLLGLAGGSLRRTRPVHGPMFGAAVWGSSYVSLPLAGLYKPIWEYSFQELAPDLVAHLVYGTATERTFRTLAPSRR